MIKRICDRCNQEIQGNYWTISIYEKEDATMRVTAAGAANNLAQNINKIFNKEKEPLQGLFVQWFLFYFVFNSE